MKYYLTFFIGLAIGLSFLFIRPPEIVEKVKTEWKRETVVLPTKIDTVYKFIERVKVEKDTVTITQVDTVVITDTIQTVISTLIYDPQEFTIKAKVFSLAPVDSAKFTYRMKEEYINSVIQKYSVKPEPEWYKYAYFGAGVLTTGIIVYLVK